MHHAHEFLEVVTATLYRVATCATTHLIDDAAILALIFCLVLTGDSIESSDLTLLDLLTRVCPLKGQH